MGELATLQDQVDLLIRERDAFRAENTAARAGLDAARHEVIEQARRSSRRRTWRGGCLIPIALGSLVAAVLAAWVHFDLVQEESWAAQVAEVRGAPPSEVGDRCEIRISPRVLFANAWFVVECEGQRIYGSDRFGYEHVQCRTAEGRAIECTDDLDSDSDGSPSLSLVRSAGQLILGDGERWSMTLALDSASIQRPTIASPNTPQ
jgi:hypothetical protein